MVWVAAVPELIKVVAEVDDYRGGWSRPQNDFLNTPTCPGGTRTLDQTVSPLPSSNVPDADEACCSRTAHNA